MQNAQPMEGVKGLIPPPVTAGFPIIGALPDLVRKQTDYLFEAWRKYGDIYILKVGSFEVLMVNHPDYVQHILRDNARNYSKGGAIWDGVRQILGNGLATSQGDYWKRQRRMMQPKFHRQYLAGISDLMIEAIEEVFAGWDKFAESGEAFDAKAGFSEMTMNVLVRAVFGRSISREENKAVSASIAHILHFFLKELLSSKLPDWLPLPKRHEFSEVVGQFDEFVYRMIRQRRENPEESYDLLSMLINMVDEESNEPMTDEQIHDEVATLFLAGYETTALAMAWGAYTLSHEGFIQDRLAAHVELNLNGRIPAFDDLKNMDYTRMVLSEALRLYPPVFWWSRSAIEADVIGNYQIKEGQLIAIMLLTLHRHPDFWPDPERFEPERFHPEAEKGRHPLAWMPFGAGQRQCIGKDFAMMEGMLILSRLMQRYRLLPSDKPAPEFAVSGTLTSKNGIWVHLEKR